MVSQQHVQASRWQVALALALVYVVWGSTYLAIRFAVETLPPFGMAAARFLVAGAALYLWARARGAARPTAGQWRSAATVGLLLLLGGNGAVVWAEQAIPSSLAALLVSTVPLFMALLEWLHAGQRPTLPVAAGLLAGFVGVVLLVDPTGLAGASVPLVPALVTTAAALSWAAGSLYARKAPAPASPLLGSAMQMLAGGLALLFVSVASGEAARFDPAGSSAQSVAALLYLVVFGSLIGFTAYAWLLRNVQPALASTYAYVNPVVAVLLGWALAGEAVGPRTLFASALIVGGVGLITAMKGRKPAKVEEPAASWPVLPGIHAEGDEVEAAEALPVTRSA